MEDLFAKFLQRLFQSFTIHFWNKHRDQLVPALTDLAPCFIQSDLDAKVLERATPGFSMQSVAVNESSVYVGEQNVRHAFS
jgi:hypothetical protein